MTTLLPDLQGKSKPSTGRRWWRAPLAVCAWPPCGKQFRTQSQSSDRSPTGRTIYCSKSCASKARRKPLVQPCGTQAGWHRHRRRGEEPCESCREANRERHRERRRARGVQPKPPLQPCGTKAGYQCHSRRGEEPCDACKQARRERDRELSRAKGVKPAQSAKCGTDGGYSRHLNRQEEPCEECRAAHAELALQRRRTAGKGPRILRPCGTVGAYKRHVASGEEPCEDCLVAYQETLVGRALWRRYRLREADFLRLLAWQEEACPCGKPFEEKPWVDHDHACCPSVATGRSCGKCVRGLLHPQCNQLLGIIEQNDDVIIPAGWVARYLANPPYRQMLQKGDRRG